MKASLWIFGIGLIFLSCKSTFIPTDFVVKEKIPFETFTLRKLTVADAVKDYQAITSSIEHLKGNTFGPRSKWLTKGLTLAKDSIDLQWHEDEFEHRRSFAYTVTDTNDTKIIGCVYIFDPKYKEYDATIYMWVTKEEFDNGLDEILFQTIKKWINEEWPFKNPAYPGRKISWENWYAKEN